MGLLNYLTKNMTKKQKVCPKGYKSRASYTRKISNSILKKGYRVRRGAGQFYLAKPMKQEIHVPSSCVKNTGSLKNKIGTFRKGDLIKYGYSYRGSDASREQALKRAVEAYGALSTYHKMNAVAKLSAKHPDIQQIFIADRNWVKTHFIKKK